ncbi:MAG: SAM-dependent methyltransferase [Bacillota bacterium]|nr:SAM-dependent methyltransferase [Bacillota bacterium]
MIHFLKSLISNSPNKLITYAEYMGAVLYDPEHGYYMKDKQKIGPAGDFITTSNVSDIFGRAIARWIAEFYKKNNITPFFCEVGAGNGRFAKAFLEEWDEKVKTPLTYMIVESSPYHRKLQNELLKPRFSPIQVETIEEVQNFEGVIFSNELFDALPIHVIEKENGLIYEVMVGIKGDKLFEEKVILSNEDIQRFLKENEIELREKQRMEIPLEMGNMLTKISSALLKGLVVTVDYGYSLEEWMEPSRIRGSLRGYYRHQMVDNVLEYPGEMDITSHIHFDSFLKSGEQLQLKNGMKFRQDEFLLNTGILKELKDHYDPNPFSEISKRNRAIRSLIMPSGMSSFFHVLIQQKKLEIKSHDLFE